MSKDASLKKLFADPEPLTKIKSFTFEQSLSLLEELVSQVESGELPLEEAIQSYQVGNCLVSHLRSLLDGAEKKLKVLEEA